MKILVIGDIHGKFNSVAKILLAARHYRPDSVILVGDIGSPILGARSNKTTMRENIYKKSLQSIFSLLDLYGLPTFFVPGNRDLKDVKAESSNIKNVDIMGIGTPASISGVNIIGIGGSGLTTGTWTYEWDDPESYLKIQNKVNQVSKPHSTILIIHDPPYYTRLDVNQMGVHSGNEAIRHLLEKNQPLLSLCGHIHESPGVDVIGERALTINVGGIIREDSSRFHITKQLINIHVSWEEQFFMLNLVNRERIEIRHFFFENNHLFVTDYIFKRRELFLSHNGILQSAECTRSREYPSKKQCNATDKRIQEISKTNDNATKKQPLEENDI